MMASDETQLPRKPLEWPGLFDGQDALQWISKAEQLFSFFEFSDARCLQIAASLFDGPVVPWFQELQQSGRVTNWLSLQMAILLAAVRDSWSISNTADDAHELLEEMPERDQGIEEMLEEMEVSDEIESEQFHQTIQDGLEESDTNLISLPASLPQEGEVQENLGIAQLMIDNAHLKPIIDDLKKNTLEAEFATVRHQLEVLEDRIDDMVQPLIEKEVIVFGFWNPEEIPWSAAGAESVQAFYPAENGSPCCAIYDEIKGWDSGALYETAQIADIVLHSTTQFMVSHSDVLGGCIGGSAAEISFYTIDNENPAISRVAMGRSVLATVYLVPGQNTRKLWSGILSKLGLQNERTPISEIIVLGGLTLPCHLLKLRGNDLLIINGSFEMSGIMSMMTGEIVQVIRGMNIIAGWYGDMKLGRVPPFKDGCWNSLQHRVTHYSSQERISFTHAQLGFVVNFLSPPTLLGFMGGAAIIVSLQQFIGLLRITHFTTKLFWISTATLISVILSTTNSFNFQASTPGIHTIGHLVFNRFALFQWLFDVNPGFEYDEAQKFLKPSITRSMDVPWMLDDMPDRDYRYGWCDMPLQSHRLLAVMDRWDAVYWGFPSIGPENSKQSDHKTFIQVGDVRTMIQYFQEQSEDPSFNFVVLLDQGDQILSIFWLDAKSMGDFCYLGDMVCFDKTFKASDCSRPFTLFVSVNKHKLAIDVGTTVMCDESMGNFQSLFDTFRIAMCGKQPKLILADCSVELTEAVMALLYAISTLIRHNYIGQELLFFENGELYAMLLGPARPPPAPDDEQSFVLATRFFLHSVQPELSGVLVNAGWPWFMAWKLPPSPNLTPLHRQFTVQDLEGKVLI